MAYPSSPVTSASSSSPSLVDGLDESTDLPPGAGTSKHVLLLLDTQCCMLSPPPIGVPSAQIVYQNLKELLAHGRSSANPPLIIHVRNTGDPGEPDEPGSPGWQLIFLPLPNEIVLDKRKNNAFAGTKLGQLIPKDAEIVIAGFQTDFSVRATCSAALGRGNEVILVRGTHGTFDREEVLHGGGMTLSSVIEAEIEEELSEAGVHVLSMADSSGIFTNR